MSEGLGNESLVRAGPYSLDIEDLMAVVQVFAIDRGIPPSVMPEILGVVAAKARLFEAIDGLDENLLDYDTE